MPQRLLIHGISSKTGNVEQGRTGDGSLLRKRIASLGADGSVLAD